MLMVHWWMLVHIIPKALFYEPPHMLKGQGRDVHRIHFQKCTHDFCIPKGEKDSQNAKPHLCKVTF
jgi:hypothetical protein